MRKCVNLSKVATVFLRSEPCLVISTAALLRPDWTRRRPSESRITKRRPVGKLFRASKCATCSRRLQSAFQNEMVTRSCKFLRWAHPWGRELIRLLRHHFTHAGQISCGGMTYSLPRRERVPWVWDSRRCLRARHSTIKRFGVRSAGRHPLRSEPQWQRQIGEWYWSLERARTRLPPKRLANSVAWGSGR